MRSSIINTALFLFVSTFAKSARAYTVSTIEQAKEFGAAISAGGYHTCALVESGVKCWGWNDDGQLNVPVLHHPKQISAGGRHTCAIDDEGVKCWGGNNYGQRSIPSLNHPRQVFAGGGHTCAIDDDGVKCWGGLNEMHLLSAPAPNHSKQIFSGDFHICSLNNSDVKCWGGNRSSKQSIPPLHNPRQISVGVLHTCALDNKGAKCWGGNNTYGERNVPILQNPTQIFAGLYNTCALDDEGVKCWGDDQYGQSSVPSLKQPKHLALGYSHTCAIDGTGVKCWGDNQYGQLNIPELNLYSDGFNLLFLEKSYKILSRHTYRDKKPIFESLSKTVAKFPVEKQEMPFVSTQEIMVRIFSMYAVAPLLQETHSDFVDNDVFPQFIDGKNEWSRRLGVKAIHDIELSENILDVCFTLVESGLRATKSYLTSPLQHNLEDLIVATALAKTASPINFRQSAQQLVSALDKHQVLLATLLQNERTAGFGKMILGIQSYLKTEG